MFCRSCPQRQQCTRICEGLEKHLGSVEGYQKEIPVDPAVIDPLYEKIGLSMRDVLPDVPWLWPAICRHFSKAPNRLVLTFLLHYYEGMTVGEVARTLSVHRTTVNRRLHRAMEILRREMARSKKGCDRAERLKSK